MKNIKNNYKIDQIYNYEKNIMKMGNIDSNEKMIQHFYLISKQRWFIHDKLKELGYEDNWELQKIYIDDFRRSKSLNLFKSNNLNSQIKKSFKKKNSKNTKKTFKNLLFKYQTDPWIIKSPHINKKIKIKIYKHNLNIIKEEKIIIKVIKI